MVKRGRPSHPDILTPREWEVLDLLRARLTNEQIAARLGISVDGAKYHVSEILSKLAVRTREEAAAWRTAGAQPWWMRLIALPAAAKIATALTIVGAVGVAGVLAFSPGGEEEVVSQEEVTEGPTATASPQGDPEGWVRFSHPGTADAPPFSFAYPGEWYVQEPELAAATLPRGEPLGTAVQVQLMRWDPSASPAGGLPPEAIRVEMYVGPVAPLTKCPPNQGPLNYSLGGVVGRRFVTPGNPPGITRTIVAYAYSPSETQCYIFFGYFSQETPDEATFDQIVESFRLRET